MITMPEPILSSQAPVTARPQTSRAVRRAFNRRRPTAPSKKDLERFAREARIERLAEEKKKKERRKKENERKRAEEKEKLKEKIKQYGVEEVIKVDEGQLRIAGFFKAGSKENTRLECLRDPSQERPTDLQKLKSPTTTLEPGSDDFLEGLSTQDLINIPTSPLRAPGPGTESVDKKEISGQKQQKHQQDQKHEGITQILPQEKERKTVTFNANTSFDGMDWGISTQELIELVP